MGQTCPQSVQAYSQQSLYVGRALIEEETRHEPGREDALDAGLQHGRLQGVGGTDLHALAAADAKVQEGLFVGRARRTQQPSVDRSGLRQPDGRGDAGYRTARDDAHQGASTREIDRPRPAAGPLPSELDDALGAEVDAVHAQVARLGRKSGGRIEGVHAAHRGAMAARLADLHRHALQQRSAAQQAQHRAGRAKIPAPKSPGHQFQGKDRRQDRRRQPGPLIDGRTVGKQVRFAQMARWRRAPVAGGPVKAGVRAAIEHRIDPERQSAHQQRERIDQSDQGKGEHGGQQNGQKQDVLRSPSASG